MTEAAPPAGRKPAPVFSLWIAVATAIVLVTAHATALAPLTWERRALTGLQPVSGFSYALPLDTKWMSVDWTGGAPIEVYENGHLLACSHSPTGEIATAGMGRFQLEAGWVFLSSSDNSDPRTNGRQYELRWPTYPGRWLRLLLLVTIGGALAVALWLSRRTVIAVLESPPLWLSLACVFIPLVAHRAWIFVDVPLPAVHPDSGSYYALARLIMQGEWPRFEIRPPAYPLFLAAVLPTTGSLFGLMIVQTLMTAASAAAVVYAVHRTERRLAIGVAIAMAGFVTGLWPIEHDTAVLSENLYVNFIVFGVGSVILGLGTGRAWPLFLASAAFGGAIVTRPAGLFLMVPYLLLLAFVGWNRYPRRMLAAASIPLLVLVFGTSTYNFVTARVFNVTAWGEANLAVATFTMWRENPAYPDDVNARVAAIRRIIDERLTDEDRATLAASWDPLRLAPVFLKGFWGPALTAASTIGPDYLESRRWIRRVAVDSVLASPATYTKFVWTMGYLFYVHNTRYVADFGDLMKYRVQNLYTSQVVAQVGTDPVRTELLTTYLKQPLPAAVDTSSACRAADQVALVPTPLRRVHRITQTVRDSLFARALWVYLAAAAFLAACVQLVRTRGRHAGAFTVFLLGATALAAGAVVCLVEYAGQRYSYPTEFLYASMVALSPLLWSPARRTPE